MIRALTFWAIVAAAAVIAWLTSAPPAPLPRDADPAVFSADRAMADVRLIAAEPHPTGSAANRAVRDRLLVRMTALGLQPVVQQGFSYGEMGGGLVGANVENIVGRLPGTDPSLPAILLMAHYDSVPGSPGAADDAAGVASILETIRALRVRGPAPRTVMVLITDGEEIGLFGAEAFWKTPAAQGVGAVINLEARGSAGPAFMFETGPDNAGVTALYGRHVARPSANSLSSWVYDRMPNGSDFTVPKRAGLPGVNIAMIGRPFDYHSATSTPANLSRYSLQHMGDQTLAMADTLRREGPGVRAPEPVYSDLFGRLHVSYPLWAGWVLLAIAGGLTFYASASRPEALRPLEMARGAGLLLLLLAAPALVAHTAFRIVPVGPDFYQSPAVAQWPLYFASMALLAAGAALGLLATFVRGGGRWAVVGLALVLGGACSLLGGFDIVGTVLGAATAILAAIVLGRRVERRPAVLGLLVAGLVLAGVLQALAPQIAFLLSWPVLATAAACAVLASPAPRPLRRALAAALVTVGLAWVLGQAAPLFDGLGLTNPELLGQFTLLAGLLLSPFALRWLSRGGGVFSASTLVIAGIAALAVVGLRNPSSPRTPQPTHVQYVVQPAADRAWLVSGRNEIDPWTRTALSASGSIVHGPFPAAFMEQAWSAPAPVVPVAAHVTASLIPGDAGVHILEFRASEPVRDLRARLAFTSAVTVLGANGVQDQRLEVKPGEEFRFRWYAPDRPVRLMFKAKGPGKVTVRHAALADGWPRGSSPLPPRPPSVMAAGASDATVSAGTTTLRW